MRFLPDKLYIVVFMLAVYAISCAPRASANSEVMPLGWYVGGSIGFNTTSGIEQAGYNRDNTCYPYHDCTHITDGSPDGYRWFYDLEADQGTVFEIVSGHAFGTFRLELALAQRRNDIEQKFTGITYLDDSHITARPMSNYQSESDTHIDDLTTRSLSLNAYYDFPVMGRRFTPYLGGGVGVSFLKLSGLYFQSWHSCKNPALDCDMPERYNGRQHVDLSDSVYSAHLYAGFDYRIKERTLLGLKLTYSMVGDMKDVKGDYDFYPVPDISNFTTISNMDHWSLMLGVKYFFGK